MKILAINSSPRGGGQSKTEWMLNHLIDGMSDAGADVEKIDLRKKKIRYCAGCFTCWTKTPGECIHKDDMTQEIFPKFIGADLAVLATPLYHFSVNAHMKTLIERTLPIIQPFLEKRDGRTWHPLRFKHPDVVMLSVAGFPEKEVFDQLSYYVNFLYKNNLLAEIYRPGAESLLQPGKKQVQMKIAEALKKAGKELVKTKTVSVETIEEIQQPIIKSSEKFLGMGNIFWKTCIAEGVTPKEFMDRKMIPRPDSIETFMGLLKMGFNSEACRDVSNTIQYRFSGDVTGDCFFTIENGSLQAEIGVCEDPSLTIEAPFDIWMDVMTGKADGQEMFIRQKYKVEGDFELLLNMEKMFGR